MRIAQVGGRRSDLHAEGHHDGLVPSCLRSALEDEEVWLHLNTVGVEPQFYALRWLLLMLTQVRRTEKAPTPAPEHRGKSTVCVDFFSLGRACCSPRGLRIHSS